METIGETRDVVVVGAGTAGLAAASILARAGTDVVVLESKHRPGGRAYTDTQSLGLPFDHGCHWFHSGSENPLVALARRDGYVIGDPPAPLQVRIDGRLCAADAVRAWQQYADSQFARISNAGEALEAVSCAGVIRPDPQWDRLFRGWFSMINGVEPERVSAIDLASYRDTGENWITPGGYGEFISKTFDGVPIALGAPVSTVNVTPHHVFVGTPRGNVQARAAIITVSTNVLSARAIAFRPPLSARKYAAAHALPLGFAEKVGFLLSDTCPLWQDQEQGLMSAVGSRVVSFQIRPQGRPMISAYFGGRLAAELARRGPGALVAEALLHLSLHAGEETNSWIEAQVETQWTIDPDVRGAYSAAIPGGPPDARKTLSEPEHGRLFFAGEATSQAGYSTAHGAYESGLRTANEVLGLLYPMVA